MEKLSNGWVRSYLLKSDKEACGHCGTCERLLRGFLTKHKGELRISGSNYATETVHESVRSLIDACPNEAITITG